jgi:hypothetical protein
VVVVFRRYARTEFCEPFQLVREAITSQVEMDAVLHDLWLGYQLEEDPRLPTRRLDQDVRVVLRVEDALAAQPGELRLIVRSNLVTVEDGGPEPGDRRGMAAIKYDIVKTSHGHIMLQPRPAGAPVRSSPRTHAAISPPHPKISAQIRFHEDEYPQVSEMLRRSGAESWPKTGSNQRVVQSVLDIFGWQP